MIDFKKLREENIRAAKNSDIPPGCEYATCVSCGTDTIVDKDGICEVCFYSRW